MNLVGNLFCFSNPNFLWRFDAILCDFQSDSCLHSWAVRHKVSCLLYLYSVYARVCLTVCHCLGHVRMETLQKSQIHNLEKVGQEIFQISTLFRQFLTNMHHTYKHDYMTFLYEVSL